jgi:hypothetical protein
VDLYVAELFVAYLRYCGQYYVKNGEVTNQVTMIGLAPEVARRLYGHAPCRDFGPLALMACRAEFIGEGLSRNQCNRRTNLINQAFGWDRERAHLGRHARRKKREEVRPSGPTEVLLTTCAAVKVRQISSCLIHGPADAVRSGREGEAPAEPRGKARREPRPPRDRKESTGPCIRAVVVERSGGIATILRVSRAGSARGSRRP